MGEQKRYVTVPVFERNRKNMNNELRDPLEKVSNSLRRAVSINRSKETDLRTTMNTIQRERRRSFNTWSLKQEKFLRAKQSLVPAMLFDRSSQAQTTKHTDARQEENKRRKRRVTLVKAVSPVTLAAAHRSRSPEVNYPLKLPDITSKQKKGAKRKKKSKSQVLPPVITLAKSSQFFQDSKQSRRISEQRQPFVSFTGADTGRETFENVEKEKRRARKLSDLAAFGSDEKQPYVSSLSNQSYATTVASDTQDEIVQKPMPDIAEERLASRQRSNETLNGDTKDLTRTNEDSLPSTSTSEKDESHQRAKGQWKKLRDSLETISEKKKKTDINKFSMMELTKLFEEIRECRYLRVGNHSRFTAEQASQNSNTCKCLACAIKDKSKLKNHLSAPE